MSCSILVDNLSTQIEPENSVEGARSTLSFNGRSSPYRNRGNLRQSSYSIISFLTRTIFFRRLKLLKVYMATVFILLLLLFVLKSSTTDKQSNEQSLIVRDSNQDINHDVLANIYETKPKHAVREQPSALDGTGDLSPTSVDTKKQRPLVDHASAPSSTLAGFRNNVSKNFTKGLKGGDFIKMSGINKMQVRVREAAKHSWDSYKRYAWGFDMLKPRSKEPDHWFDLGLTIVDAADALIIMGLTQEAESAIDWMKNELRFDSKNENSNCFEMTIRILAGLLSTYHLTGSEKLKHKVIDFGDILLHCYDTKSGIVPYSDIDLNTKRAHGPNWNPSSSLSEVTSLQLEFRFLSQISGDPKYEAITFRTSEHVHNLTRDRIEKLLPMYISPDSGQLEESIITLGARTDSYYEYLLKQYLQTGIKWLETDYLDAIDQIQGQLMRHTDGEKNYTYIAEMMRYKTENDTDEVRYFNKMDHLVCFLPGTLILGYYHYSPLAKEFRIKYNLETNQENLNPRYNNHMEMAQAIARTCYHMYREMGTGLAPEIAIFVHSNTDDPILQNQPELTAQAQSAHNILRPEYVESLFYLYHITGLPVYRKQAQEIFEAFQTYSRIPSGYSAVSDVRRKPSPTENIDEVLHRNAPDKMESFWLSETLKYLYLIFCDDPNIIGTILNNYVFNTEAHLFPLS